MLANEKGRFECSQVVMNAQHQLVHVTCVCVCRVCRPVVACAVACECRRRDSSGSNAPCAHSLFVRYCMVYYKHACKAAGTSVWPLSSSIAPPQSFRLYLPVVCPRYMVFSCFYVVFLCPLMKQPPPKYPQTLHFACPWSGPMTRGGGAWWSNVRTLFAVDEVVPSSRLCVCVCVCARVHKCDLEYPDF